MAISHAFKTIRHAGTPSAGGNIHTLESHIGSSSAHPIYMKKGDKVGDYNLSDHESDVNAHRQYYIRRLEMMTTLEEYQEYRKTDPSLYSGLEPSNIGTVYPMVVTAKMLSDLFEDDDALGRYLPGVFLKKNIIQKEDKSDWPQYTSDYKDKVPGWIWFYPLYVQVQTHEYDQKEGSERLLSDNPLAKIFALIDHNHDDEYAALGHTHTFDDVRNSLGEKPASENHNHDDVYLKKEDLEDLIDSETDLSPLTKVGIYPQAVSADLSDASVNLNERVTQGCELYSITRNSTITGFPSDVVTAIAENFSVSTDSADVQSTNTSARVNALVQVMHGAAPAIDFDNFAFSTFIGIPDTDRGNAVATTNFIGPTTSQILITMPGIQPYDREGGTDLQDLVKTYHEGLHDMYWRMGCCYESAWYITRVVEDLLDLSPKEFYETVRDASDPVSMVYSLLEARLTADYTLSTTTPLPNGIIAGYFNPKPAEFFHPARSRWLADISLSTNSTSIYAKHTTMKTNGVVAHDSVAWLVPETVLMGASAGSLDHLSDFNNLKVVAPGTDFLDYATYFVNHVEFTLYSALNGIIVSTQKYYGEAAEGTELTLKGGKVTWNSTMDAVEGTSISGTDMVHTEYHPIAVGTFSGLRDYYTKDDTPEVDQYGVPTYTKLNSPSGSISDYTTSTGKTVYQKVTITNKRGNLQWSKRPCKRDMWVGSTHYTGEEINTSKTYYTYDNDTKAFTAIEIGYGEDGYVPTIEGAGPIFTDWDVYKRTSTLIQQTRENYKSTPILKSGLPFYKNVTYLAHPNYYQNTALTKSVVIVDPTIIETPSDLDEFYDFSSHKFYTKNITTGEILEVSDVSAKKDELLGYVENDEFTTDLRLCYTTEDTGTVLYYPEGFKYTFDESVTSGANVLRFSIREVTYALALDDPSNYLYTRAFAYPTQDTTVIPGKKYYTAVEENVFNRVVSPASNPKEAAYYEVIDTEALCNIWLAIKQLTETGSDIAIGTDRVQYIFADDGSLVTWKDWERVITPNDKDFKELLDAVAAQQAIDPTFTITKWIQQSHAHDNKTLLDGFKVEDGSLWYKDGDEYVQLTNYGEASTFDNKEVLEKIFSASEGTGKTKAANELWLELKDAEDTVTHKRIAFGVEVEELRDDMEKALADIETGRSGSISVNIADVEVDTDGTQYTINGAKYWKVEEISNPTDFLFSVHAMVEDTNSPKTFSYDIPSLMALVNYAAGDGTYVPTVVPADSLLLVDRTNEVVYLRVPEQWIDNSESPSNKTMTIYVRRAKCSSMNGSYVWSIYDSEDATGTIRKTINATYGSALEAFTVDFATPTKTNYRFDGWNFNGVKYYNADGSTDKTCLVVGNQSLYARFVAQLKINTQDYSGASTSTQVLEGSESMLLPTPTRSGFNFKGWQLSGGSATLINAGTQLKIGNIVAGKTLSAPGSETFIGQWDTSGWTVTLNATGGTAVLNSIAVTYDSAWPTIASANLPTRTGYGFQGYYTQVNGGGTKIYNADGTSSSIVNNTSINILYAYWLASTGLIITLRNTATGSTYGTLNATYDSALPDMTLDAPTRTGYTFGGWQKDSTLWYNASGVKQLDKYSVNGNTTLDSKWTANTYRVTLKNTPQNTSTTITATYDQVLPAQAPLVNTGHKFNGWWYQEDGKDDVQYYTATGGSAVTKFNLTKDVTLVDKWDSVSYTIYLVNEGVTLTSPVITATYGQTLPDIVFDTPLTKTGHTLQGWYTSSNGGGTKIYTADGKGISVWTNASGMSLYSYWKADTMTVTLDQGDDEDITAGTTSTTVTYGQAMPSISVPSRTDGYVLDGFYDAETGGTKYYDSTGRSVHVWDKTAAATLYARWTKTKSTITWNNMGTTSTSQLTIGDLFSSNMPSPTATGRTFYRWESEDGTVYTQTSTVPSEDITLYAKWLVDITFISGVSTINNQTYTAMVVGTKFSDNKDSDNNVKFPADMSTSGSIFRGFYTDSTNGTRVTQESTVPETNTSYYAQWMRDITFGPSDTLSGNGVVRIRYGEVDGEAQAVGVDLRYRDSTQSSETNLDNLWHTLPTAVLPIEGSVKIADGTANYQFPVWVGHYIGNSQLGNCFYIGDSLQNKRSETIAVNATTTLKESSRVQKFNVSGSSAGTWTPSPALTTNPTSTLQLHQSPYLEIRKKGVAFMSNNLKAKSITTDASWNTVLVSDVIDAYNNNSSLDLGNVYISIGCDVFSSSNKSNIGTLSYKTYDSSYRKLVSNLTLTAAQVKQLRAYSSSYLNPTTIANGSNTDKICVPFDLAMELLGITVTKGKTGSDGFAVYTIGSLGYSKYSTGSGSYVSNYCEIAFAEPKELDLSKVTPTTDTTVQSGKVYYALYTTTSADYTSVSTYGTGSDAWTSSVKESHAPGMHLRKVTAFNAKTTSGWYYSGSSSSESYVRLTGTATFVGYYEAIGYTYDKDNGCKVIAATGEQEEGTVDAFAVPDQWSGILGDQLTLTKHSVMYLLPYYGSAKWLSEITVDGSNVVLKDPLTGEDTAYVSGHKATTEGVAAGNVRYVGLLYNGNTACGTVDEEDSWYAFMVGQTTAGGGVGTCFFYYTKIDNFRSKSIEIDGQKTA